MIRKTIDLVLCKCVGVCGGLRCRATKLHKEVKKAEEKGEWNDDEKKGKQIRSLGIPMKECKIVFGIQALLHNSNPLSPQSSV
jgi:hypothetical protein